MFPKFNHTRGFSPTENEIRYAKQVIEAYEKSQEEGSFYTFKW